MSPWYHRDTSGAGSSQGQLGALCLFACDTDTDGVFDFPPLATAAWSYSPSGKIKKITNRIKVEQPTKTWLARRRDRVFG